MKSSCHTGVHCSFHTKKEDLFVNSFKQIDQCQGLNYHLKLIMKPSHPELSPDEVPWYQDIYMLFGSFGGGMCGAWVIGLLGSAD